MDSVLWKAFATVVALVLLGGITWGAADDRFKGGSYDGYEILTLADQAIPEVVPKGFFMMIR